MKCANLLAHNDRDAVGLLVINKAAVSFIEYSHPVILVCEPCTRDAKYDIASGDNFYRVLSVPEIPPLELLL